MFCVRVFYSVFALAYYKEIEGIERERKRWEEEMREGSLFKQMMENVFQPKSLSQSFSLYFSIFFIV